MKRQIPETDNLIPFDLDRKYTVAQIAEQAGKSTKTIRKWITTRKLTAYDFDRGFVITATDWNDFADKRKLKMVHSMLRDPYEMSDFDPAYEPPMPTKVNIADLTDEQLNAAIILPPNFDRFDASVVSNKTTSNDQDFSADERRWIRDWLEGKTDE